MIRALPFLLLLWSTAVADVNVSPQFAKHIEEIEGFRAQAYRDIAGVWTIGYGHAIKPSEKELMTVTLTRDDASALLKKDTAWAVRAVNDNVQKNLRQEQFDALVSFVFNVGETQFRRSTLLKRLNAGHCCAVPDELRRWTRVNGQVAKGLVNRRNAEIALYTGEA